MGIFPGIAMVALGFLIATGGDFYDSGYRQIIQFHGLKWILVFLLFQLVSLGLSNH